MAKAARANRKKQAAVRSERGQFVPGVSGNPNGRPPVDKQLAEVVREKWPADKLVAEVAKLVKSRNLEVRIRAIQWLADRGYGKAKETIDLNVGGEVHHSHAHVHMTLMNETHVERRRRLEELRQKQAAQLPAPAVAPAVIEVDDDADAG